MISWPVVDGVTFTAQPPSGSTALAEEALPQVDLGSVAGAKVVLRKGTGRVNLGPTAAQHAYDALVAVCVSAPAAHFAPEMEPLVFSKLNEVAKAELAKGATVERYDESPPIEHDLQIEETFRAEGQIAGVPRGDGPALKKRAEGRHTLAFVNGGEDILACSVVCSEYTADSARVCAGILATAHLEGKLSSPPSSSLPARLAVAAAKRPLAALGAIAGLLLVLAGLAVALLSGKRRVGQPAS